MDNKNVKKTAILYAFPLEGNAILKNFRKPVEHSKGIHTYKNFLIYQTGVGKEKTTSTMKKLFDFYPVIAVLGLGTAGALTEELKIGDIIIADKIIEDKNEKVEELEIKSAFIPELALLLKEKGFVAKIGTLLTVKKALFDKDSKEAANKKYNAIACDMESSICAEYSALNGIPYYNIRVISDNMIQKIPVDFPSYFTENDKIKIFKLFLKAIINPCEAYRIVKTFNGFKKALHILTLVCGHILKKFVK